MFISISKFAIKPTVVADDDTVTIKLAEQDMYMCMTFDEAKSLIADLLRAVPDATEDPFLQELVA